MRSWPPNSSRWRSNRKCSRPRRLRSMRRHHLPLRAAPAPVAAAPSQDDKLAQLTQLGQLKTAGVLTEAEFEAEKAKILGS